MDTIGKSSNKGQSPQTNTRKQPTESKVRAEMSGYERTVELLRERLSAIKSNVDVDELAKPGATSDLDPQLQKSLLNLRHVLDRAQNNPQLLFPGNESLADIYTELLECEVAISENIRDALAVVKKHKSGEPLDSAWQERVASIPIEYEELNNRRRKVLEKLLDPQWKIEEESSNYQIETTSEVASPTSSVFESDNTNDQETSQITPAKVTRFNRQFELFEDLHTCNSLLYVQVREALAKGDFSQVEGSPWPTATFNRKGVTGNAQLMPPIIETQPLMPPEEQERWVQLMWRQREELSDLDADALDLLCHTWLKQVTKPEDSAVAIVDDFLAMRKLKPKQSGQRRRGGYEPEQRLEMLRALSHIQSLWLNMGTIETYEADNSDNEETDNSGSVESGTNTKKNTRRKKTKAVRRTIQSRAFVVTDRLGQLNMDGYMDVEQFVFQPGKLFARFLLGPGQQTALLSIKAVEYDPYRQRWEKRLTRYLSWQWRIQASHGDYTRSYRVSTLLEAVGVEANQKRPGETRDRLEKALDILQEDNVLAQWHYDSQKWKEEWSGLRGWVNAWLQATIIVEPPDIVRESYLNIERRYQVQTQRETTKSNQLSAVDNTRQRAVTRERRSNTAAINANKSNFDPSLFGTQIAERRKALQLFQAELAEQFGITQSYLSKLEKGLVKPAPELHKQLLDWLEKTDLL
jgi:ribosome-binding protein aMBF1 (putative translation factor)